MGPVEGANGWARGATRSARRGGGAPLIREPESRFCAERVTVTGESASATRLDGRRYAVRGEAGEQGRWQLRLWWKPFVTLIWFGGALVALGGAMSLLGRWRRERRTAARGAEAFA